MAQFNISSLAAALETMRHDFHFPGHLLPGTAFIMMGVWWMWNAFKIYSENEYRRNSEHLLNEDKNCDASNSCSFFATYNGDAKGILSCEGFYKIAYASFDLICHILVIVYGGDLTDERQHMTVYVFFILNGIVDFILHTKLYKIPDGIDYMASSIAWAGFGSLFISHTHGKTKISIFYHQTLGWLAVAVAVITILQYKYEKNFLVSLTRGCCCTLVGTWLYQVAFSFHNPFIAANQYRNLRHDEVITSGSSMDGMNGTNMSPMGAQMQTMNAVTIATWHVILVCCFAAFVGVVATRRKQVYYNRIRHCCV